MDLSEIDLLNTETYLGGLPHEQYALLREKAPCFLQTCSEPGMVESAWLLTRYEDVRRVNRDSVNFLNYKGVTPCTSGATLKGSGRPGMTSLDGKEHQRNRKLVSQGFTRNTISAFEETFRAMARQVVSKAIARQQFDFVTEIAVELPMQVICELMGVPKEDHYKVLDWSNTIASPQDPRYSPSPEAQMAAIHALWDYGLELAELRKREPGEDIISKLVQALDGELLTDGELMGFSLLLIAAGNETTRNALTLGVYELMKHPEQMAWLRAQPSVPDTAVEEILRYSSPVVFMRRTAAHDLELHGCAISEGDAVMMMYASANFDPDQFEDPMAFDLRRYPNPHLTFGFGNHFCLGSFVARLEIKILLEELLGMVDSITIEQEPTYGPDFYFRPVRDLLVSVDA